MNIQHVKAILGPEVADCYFELLKNEIPWRQGIYNQTILSPSLIHKVEDNTNPIDNAILELIDNCLERLSLNGFIHDVYLEYYRNGQDWAPFHHHCGEDEIVISLGATRKLFVGSSVYNLRSGDLIIYNQAHGIAEEKHIKNGHISITCLFLRA